MSLTKDHLIVAIAQENGFPKKQSTEIVETLLKIIKLGLSSGEDVLISGFGKFSVKKKKARKGRNPATGEDMILESRRVVTFKCLGKLRHKINKSQ
jgi:integration host factor subunit alpha